MIRLLLKHELLDILAGPRFAVIFAISATLLILGTVVGVREYHRGVDRYEVRTAYVEEGIRSADNWFSVRNSVQHRPDPLSVFVSGISFDLGESVHVGGIGGAMRPTQSVFSGDPLFAFFRFLDFSFVFQFVVSLLAILLTYDRISGERDAGTLRLLMSNSIPRVHLLVSKLLGAWIGLVVPILLVTGLCILLALLLGVPLSGGDAARLGVIVLTSVLYFSCFIGVGMLVSASTRSPSTSFLLLLVIWVSATLIVPRVATEIAGRVHQPMTVAELQSEQWRFIKDMIARQQREYDAISDEYRKATEGMTAEERRAYGERAREEMGAKYSAIMERFQRESTEHMDKLQMTRRAGVRIRRALALNLSRMSCAGLYRVATIRLAGTGLRSQNAFEDAIHGYSIDYQRFIMTKTREANAAGSAVSVDPTEMPRFVQAPLRAGEAIASAMLDIGLLVLYTVLAIAGAFIAFLRYDVR